MKARTAFVCALFFLFQLLLAPRIAIGSISPDFLLLLTVYFSLTQGPIRGSVAGFIVGVIQDLFNPHLLGLNALTKTVVGFGAGYVGGKTDPENAVMHLALFFVAALAHDFLYLLFFTGLHPGRFLILFFTVAAPSAVYTAVIGAVVQALVAISGFRKVRTYGKAR